MGATRVTLDVVVTAFLAGATPEEIVIRFPTLLLADVYGTVALYLSRTSEVDEYLASRDADAAAHRARSEAVEPMSAIRSRLLARERIAS